MNTYKTSTGERLKKSVIDSLVKKAKKEKIKQQFDQFGFNFCEDCHISSGVMLDCSHDISVKECQESGQSEKAFDVNNITIRCRSCHQKKDKLHIQSGLVDVFQLIDKAVNQYMINTGKEPGLIFMHPEKIKLLVADVSEKVSLQHLQYRGADIKESPDLDPDQIVVTADHFKGQTVER